MLFKIIYGSLTAIVALGAFNCKSHSTNAPSNAVCNYSEFVDNTEKKLAFDFEVHDFNAYKTFNYSDLGMKLLLYNKVEKRLFSIYDKDTLEFIKYKSRWIFNGEQEKEVLIFFALCNNDADSYYFFEEILGLLYGCNLSSNNYFILTSHSDFPTENIFHLIGRCSQELSKNELQGIHKNLYEKIK